MPDSSPDKALLTRALAKFNALADGDTGEFSPEEALALRGFVASKSNTVLNEREQSFVTHLREVLERHASAAVAEAEDAERRKNVLLRGAIDKCQQGNAASVTPAERQILENTAARLNAVADPSASHLRLRTLVAAALEVCAALEACAAADAARVEPAPVAIGTSRVVETSALFEGTTRSRMREFGEILLDINSRIVEIEGNIELNGDLPGDATLVVKAGDVVLRGACNGNVLAQGGVKVLGNVGGAWTISSEGAIQCERVLDGASLIAPHGAITCTAMERPGRVFSGVAILVESDARGGVLIAPEITVNGAARGLQTQVLRSFICGELSGEPREVAQVIFRNMLVAEDYRASVSDETLTHMRDLMRFRFREAIGQSLLDCIRADFCGVQRARLFGASGKGADIVPLRTAQSKAAYLGVAVTAAECLEQILLEALELEGDAQTAALTIGCDESHHAVKFIEREVSFLSDDATRETKALLTTCCKHLANISKKMKDHAEQRAALEESAHALLTRLGEWRAQRAAAAHALADVMLGVGAAIGAGAAGETDPARLAQPVADAMLHAGGLGNTPPMRSMKVLADRYVTALSHYTNGAAEVRAERLRLEAQLDEDPSVVVGGGRQALRFVRAAKFGPHVLLSTSPGATAPSAGDLGLDEGRTVRIDREIPGGASFVCDGLKLRRETD